MENNQTKVIFYFPWKEISGGPIYLTRLADELARDPQYDVHYVDYENGLSDNLLKNPDVKRITVSEQDFSIRIDAPVTLITPIYWACWLPQLHPSSKVLFLNWHNCCIPVLQDNWRVSPPDLNRFLKLVQATCSVFFCDHSHWMAQNTKDIIFAQSYVPISLPEKTTAASIDLLNSEQINIGILGRLCADKIYAVLNVLDNLHKLPTTRKKNVYIIGDGPDRKLINPELYPDIDIIMTGVITGPDLDAFLASKIDILFGMGTSILEGAAAKLPSVIIPHNMHPLNCDDYVYLQDSVGYCLGWYDTQVVELGLRTHPLAEIIADVYDRGKKALLANNAYSYFLSHHTIQSAIAPLKTALQGTTLTFKDFKGTTSRFQNPLHQIQIFGISLVGVYRRPSGAVQLRALDRVTLASLNDSAHAKSIQLLGLPVFRLRKSGLIFRGLRFIKRTISFMRRRIHERDLSGEILSGVHAAEKRILEIQQEVQEGLKQTREEIKHTHEGLHQGIQQAQVALKESREWAAQPFRRNVLQMDTCDKLIPAASFERFTGDIREDYQNLVRGLDQQSRDVISRALSRAQNYWTQKTSYFWMTKNEREELIRIYDQHSSRIVKLSENCYAYGDYLLPKRIVSTTTFFYDHFVPEFEDLESIRNKSIIDAGGFIGDSAIVLSKYTDRDVHVFEPVAEMYKLCADTIHMNGTKNVVLNRIALGSTVGQSVISVLGDASTLRSDERTRSLDCEREVVEITTIDDYVQRHGLQVGLIKVDVEGFEQELLKGAENTIRSQRPALLLSIYHNADDFFRIKPLIESWGLGYKFKIRKPSDQTILIDTTLIAEVDK